MWSIFSRVRAVCGPVCCAVRRAETDAVDGAFAQSLDNGYTLQITADSGWSPEVGALAELVAGMLPLTIAELLHSDPTVVALQLMERVSHGVSSGAPLPALYSLVGDVVDIAFPGLWLQVLLLDAGEEGLRLQAGFGPGASSTPPPLASGR